jgi:hypothetical protein
VSDPIPMPFSGKDVPHIVIEVNQACNVTCKACYKDKHGYTKPLELILEEIDVAAEARNLDMLTLAGGEPSMHPQLEQVIAHATAKGIKTSLLTNGTLLDDERLKLYADAGLTRVALHVDTLQERPDTPEDVTCERDLDPLRLEIFERVAGHGLLCGLVATLYQSNLGDLPEMIDFATRCRHVSLVLVTTCTDFRPIASAYGRSDGPAFAEHDALADEIVTCDDVMELMERECGLRPVHYVPSDRRLDEKRWLLYLGFAITDRDGEYDTLYLSSKYRRTVTLANEMQRWTKGRYKFDMVPGRFESVVVCVGYALLGMDLRNVFKTFGFLLGLLKPGTRIHSKVLVFQQPPSLHPDGGIEQCDNCPDATVRNGEIVPLCLADILSPLEQARPARTCEPAARAS